MSKIYIGRLKANPDDGTGKLIMSKGFSCLPPILRADILKDIKGEIDALYEQALKDMRPVQLRETEH